MLHVFVVVITISHTLKSFILWKATVGKVIRKLVFLSEVHARVNMILIKCELFKHYNFRKFDAFF